jgi:hypothetical protein
MRLAASSASASVKRRAVEPVNKVKILPVNAWHDKMTVTMVLTHHEDEMCFKVNRANK